MSERRRHPSRTVHYRTYRVSRPRRRRRSGRWLALLAFLVLLGAAAAAGWMLVGPDDGDGGAASMGASVSPAAKAPVELTSSPSPKPTQKKPTVVEIGWVGDTTPGSRYGMPPDGGRALFVSVREQLRRPDLMIANLEGTYSTATTSKGSGPNTFCFQAPPSYAKALVWAGVDAVSLANNHSHDYLELGLEQTKQALEAVGLEYAGIPNDEPIVDVQGVSVALLAFSPYPWNEDLNDIPAARALVRRAAKSADLVIVLMHAGAEGSDKIHTPRGSEFAFGENRGNSRAFAHAVVDAGADLVLGSGPHVIRGIERYKDRLIAYSLGNFGGWGNFGTGGTLSLSGILTVRIDETGRIRGGRWLSILIGGPGVPRIDGSNAAAGLVRQLSAADFDDTYPLDAKGRFTGR